MIEPISASIDYRGCPLHYTVRGEGPPVVFIQGTGVHGEAWLPQVKGLESRFRCLYFDNRGIGKSQPAGAPISVERMAEDVGALIDAMRWDSAHIVGHSLGGLVAQCVALSMPEKVRSLSLLCTFARGADVTRMTWEMLWRGLRTYVGTRRMRRLAFLDLVMPAAVLREADRDALAARLADLFGHDLADQPAVVMQQLAAMSRYDATAELGRLAGRRTLIAIAAHDRIARPELGQSLARGIPDARMALFPDAAHGLCLQRPEAINALLAEHFCSCEDGNLAQEPKLVGV